MAAGRSSERRPPAPGALLAGAGFALLGVAHPWLLDAALARLGARGVALLLLAVLALSLPLRGPAAGARRVGAAFLAGLLALGAARGDPLFLRLLPACVYLGLAALFAASLRGPASIVEAAARWLVPEAPLFIRGYCRAVTALWAACFLAIAGIVAWLAAAGDAAAWRAATSRGVWLAMGAFALVEFLFRKTWFRYYFRGGPFERLWSRLFPAERTERGRRSLAYIDATRARLARETAAARPD